MEFDRLRLCFSFELTLCFRSNRFFFAFMVLLFFLKKTNLHFPRKHNFCISTAAHCSVSALLFLPQNSRCICSTNPLHARGGQKTSQSNHLIVVTDANFSNTFSFFFFGPASNQRASRACNIRWWIRYQNRLEESASRCITQGTNWIRLIENNRLEVDDEIPSTKLPDRRCCCYFWIRPVWLVVAPDMTGMSKQSPTLLEVWSRTIRRTGNSTHGLKGRLSATAATTTTTTTTRKKAPVWFCTLRTPVLAPEVGWKVK